VHELYASLILLPEWKSNPNLRFFNETYRFLGANKPDEISYKYTVDKMVDPLTNYFNGVIAKNEQDRELGVKIILTIAPINHVFIEWTNEVAAYDKFLSELIQRLETELSKMKPQLPN